MMNGTDYTSSASKTLKLLFLGKIPYIYKLRPFANFDERPTVWSNLRTMKT